ncbi:hypothetical protein M422DRAFT_37553 [Sphaerobolus stellatus SS14]|uniref:Uncharacterized protein n=1 Tax=Sphaerobolus stellatus (strain SS14) TaxID=990650 RepID=A0A0C9UFP5_SPHS4|nr:hypothetical protein M422DRAFT_37553 [Sphaerobolus stellatus SS14]
MPILQKIIPQKHCCVKTSCRFMFFLYPKPLSRRNQKSPKSTTPMSPILLAPLPTHCNVDFHACLLTLSVR